MATKYMNQGKKLYAVTWNDASQYPFQFRNAADDDGSEFGSKVLITDASGNVGFGDIADYLGNGDVTGPGSSTDNAVARFSGSTGKIIQNSGVIIDDSNNVTGVVALTATGVVTASNASNAIRIGTSCDMTTPPAIGGTTPNSGAFTTLSATGAVTLSGDITQTGDNDDNANISQITYYDDTFASQLWMFKARGNSGAPATVQTDDFLGNIVVYGHDGSNWVRAGSLRARVDATPGSGDVNARWIFATGESDPETALVTIYSNGDLEVGGTVIVSGGVISGGGFGDQVANTVFAGPSTGADDAPAFRALVDADIPAAIARDSEVTSAIAALSSVYQPLDAELSAIAGLTSAADKLPYFTGSGTASVADLTSVARTLIAQSSQANMRTTGLGLGTIATQAASSVALTGGTIDGINIGATTPGTGAFTTLSASSTLGVTGNLNLGAAAGGAYQMQIQGAAGNARSLVIKSGSSLRSAWIVTGAAESGSDAGSSTVFRTYLDDGVTSTDQITFTRATGAAITMARPLTATSIQNTPIGATTPSTGAFTTLSSTGTASFSGNTTVGGNAVSGPSLMINGAAGTNRSFKFLSGGSERARIYVSSGAESGSDAGSVFAIALYSDSGTFIDTPITIARASGSSINMSRPVIVGSNLTVNGNTTLGDANTDTITCTGRLLTRDFGGTSVACTQGEFGHVSGVPYFASATGSPGTLKRLATTDLSPTWTKWLSAADANPSPGSTTIGGYTMYVHPALTGVDLTLTWAFQLPDDFSSSTNTLKYRLHYALQSNGSAGEEVAIRFRADAVGNADTVPSPTTLSTEYIDCASLVNNTHYVLEYSSNPGNTPVAGDMVCLEISRQTGDARDDYSASVYIIGVEVTYA